MNGNKKIFYEIARTDIRDMEEYDPGPMPADISVRISANENNCGVPPLAREALIKAIDDGNRYGDSRCDELRAVLASRHGLSPEQILVGNGLDGVFTMLGRAFLEPGRELITGELTFSVYAETARIAGAAVVQVPMTEDFALSAQGFIGSVTKRTGMICFCNPNNPTGTAAGISEIVKMLDALPQSILFVLDEAYIDFADDPSATGMKLLGRYRNLIVCRTFSKIFGLAGLRVGYIAADPELLSYVYKVREPYCVNTLAASAAAAALRDEAYLRNSRETVIREREKLQDFFRGIGIKFVPSQTNFIMLRAENAVRLRDRLLGRGVAVRLLCHKGKKNILRITVGLPEENEYFKKVFAEAHGIDL